MVLEYEGGHAETTVQQLAALYDEHDRGASPIQRLANRRTAALGRPLALTIISGAVIMWIIGNYAARWFGSTAFEDSVRANAPLGKEGQGRAV